MVFPSTALNFSLFSKKVKIKLKEKFLKLESSSTPKIFFSVLAEILTFS
jgi:hypothetical protein